jgi:ABC-type hemin transport system substrate-binding protein
MNIEIIKVKVNKVSEPSLFHGSRQDIRTLAKMCNILREKCNELVETVNNLSSELEEANKKLELQKE